MRQLNVSCADPENSVYHKRISQRVIRTSLEKQLDRMSPIASRGGSVPVFLEEQLAACDFPGGGGPNPLFLSSGSAHVCVNLHVFDSVSTLDTCTCIYSRAYILF